MKKWILGTLAVVLLAGGALSLLTVYPAADSDETAWAGLRLVKTESRQSGGTVWNLPDEPLPCARFWIHERSGTILGRAAARALRDAIEAEGGAEAAIVERGGLVSGGLPDVHLAVEVVAGSERVYPGFLELSCELRVTADRRPPSDGELATLPPGPILLESGIEYSETTYGVVTPNRRHDGAVAALVEVIDLSARIAQWRAGPGPAAR